MTKTIITILFLTLNTVAFSQQDPQYTQYMYNMPVINPAYSGSSGIACLTFESDTLALKWETHSESFETLHGIDVSSDGERIYVSGRKDGNLHIFNGGTGKLERSISLGNNPLAGGVQVFSSP